jgi:hypothetical protein
MAGSHVF